MADHIARRSRTLLVVGVAALGAGLLPASSALADDVPPSTDICHDTPLTQPFAAVNDYRQYALVPGESAGSFDGAGWSLLAPAGVVDDGTGSRVLDLPSGAVATSPPICVNSNYPTARARIRNVQGGEGVQFYVSYARNGVWTKPKNTGQIHGEQNRWTASANMNLQPGPSPDWELVRFTFIAGGKTSDFQVYDIYVDPYAKR